MSRFRLQADGLGDQLGGRPAFLSLQQQHAEQMQRFGVIGHQAQRMPVEGFRLPQASGEVIFACALEEHRRDLVLSAHDTDPAPQILA